MALNTNPDVDLKNKYRKIFQISLIISLSLLIVAFEYSPNAKHNPKVVPDTDDVIHVSDTQPTTQITNPPPPPKPVVPVIAESGEQPGDIDLPGTELEENAPVAKLPPKRNRNISDEPYLKIPDQLPEPVGGISAIKEKITYPELAKRIGLEGRVYIRVFLDKKGNVVDAKIEKGIGGGCDEAALNAVKETKFYPGKQRGRPVRVQVVIPVDFRLSK